METPSKLCLMIVSGGDAGSLMDRLVEAGMAATKLGSTGGFLRRGNATIISGVADHQVEELVGIVRDVCHARVELIPVQALPLTFESGFASDPVEIRAGGATVFVLNVERFEQV